MSSILVVDALVWNAGLLKENDSNVGIPIVGIASIGLVATMVGIISSSIASRWLLKERDQVGIDSVLQI